MKQLVLILFCGTLIGSCTITKRHFGNGYHVEWNRKMKATTDPEEKSKVALTDNSIAPENIPDADSLSIEEPARVDQSVTDIPAVGPKEETAGQPVQHQQFQPGTEIRKDPEIKTRESKPMHDLEEEMNRPRLHPLTWAIWGSWTIAMVSILLLFGGLEVLSLVGFTVSLFIGMIFAIIMIASLVRHPERYKHKGLSYGFAIPAIILGGLALLIGTIILTGNWGISY